VPGPAGQFSLNISVVGSGRVTSMPGGIDCGADCAENYNSGANVTLTATPGTGFRFSGWSGACSGGGACVAAMSANRTVTATFAAITGSALLMLDTFEYAVGRDDADATAKFIANGPWSHVKTVQSGDSGANGYIYTVDQIPGYSGNFPGQNSTRVLALEARPYTRAGQTDFYIQYGDGLAPIGHIPANHWYQFWVYPADAGSQRSLFSQGKFIYPNRADFYPASLNNGGYVYILGLSKGSAAPLNLDPCPGGDAVGCPSFFLYTGWNTVNGITNNVTYSEGSFGQNLANDIHARPNQWTLVKIHIDLSGTDARVPPGQAVFEMWIRRAGSSAWIKTTEYLGGVTSINGAPISFIPAYNDGFRMFRMPTTFGATNADKDDWFDSWTYIDDFTLAGSEAALPVYPN
jgi:hypothetical protein